MTKGQRWYAQRVLAVKALGHPLPPRAEVHAAGAQLVICQDRAYYMLLRVRRRVHLAGGDPDRQRICARCRDLTAFADLLGGGAKKGGQNVCRECHRRDQQDARRKAT